MRFLRRLTFWWRARANESDLAEEIAAHEAMKAADLERRGLPPDAAAHAGRRAMGNVTRMREDARAVWIWPWLEGVAQDATYAARMLRRHPGFAVVAVVALGIAIGVNTSMFTVFNALTVRPWDVPQASRMASLYDMTCCKRAGGQPNGFSLGELRFLVDHAHTIDGAYATRHTSEASDTDDDALENAWVSANYFALLGVQMAKGRGFAADEDVVNAPRAVAVLSWGTWQARFGGDEQIIGKIVRLHDEPFTIVGVTPQSFAGTETREVDVWTPLAAAALIMPGDRWVANVLRQPDHCCTSAVVRLAPGASEADALAELARLSRTHRAANGIDEGRIALEAFTPLASARSGQAFSLFALIFAGCAAVLLLACANVGNLLLARAAARQREIAMRMSLGASRPRVIRQLLTEGAVLALLAGGIGIWLATVLPSRILPLVAGQRVAVGLAPDARVLAFALALSILTCLVFALAPALQATRPASQAGVRLSLRTLFLSAQAALCVVLLVAAALLARAVQRASSADLGFAVSEVASLSFAHVPRAYTPERTAAFVAQLADRARALPVPAAVAFTSGLPLESVSKADVRRPTDGEDRKENVLKDAVSPGYFAALSLQVVAGRLFTPDDGRDVIVVNEALARKYWGVAHAVGQVLVADRPLRVAGVIRDARVHAIDAVYESYYEPFDGRTMPHVLVRGGRGAMDAARAAIRDLDPRLTTRELPLTAFVDRRLSDTRSLGQLASGLGLLALLLATIGMFGVFDFWVRQRTPEIGVRMALGAGAGSVIRLVVGASARAIGGGVIVGALLALGMSRALESRLFGMSGMDPVAYLGVGAVLLGAGLVAVYLPARRATRVDPVMALRAE